MRFVKPFLFFTLFFYINIMGVYANDDPTNSVTKDTTPSNVSFEHGSHVPSPDETLAELATSHPLESRTVTTYTGSIEFDFKHLFLKITGSLSVDIWTKNAPNNP